MHPRPRRTALALAVLLALLTSCGGRDNGTSDRLLVLAATSLNRAAPRLAEAFEESTGVPVDFVLASTGNLAAQIENGAPADVFLSADTETPDLLVGADHLRPETVRVYAAGELVIVWRDGAPPPASVDALAAQAYSTVAIANPDHAPYGVAAREALVNAGVWDAVRPRLVYAESVAQALQLVLTGNADAALVARSAALDAGGSATAVDPSLYTPIRHAAGIPTASTHPAAPAFLDFLTSPTGRGILKQSGFTAP